MTPEEMRKVVDGELEHIPKGDFLQNQLRMIYNDTRMSSLGKKNPHGFRGADEVLRYCIEFLRKDNPGAVFEYDRKFFGGVVDEVNESGKPEILTLDQIRSLPRWARVAFAARCARRVIPLFRRFWPEAPPAMTNVARAADLAERTAANAIPVGNASFGHKDVPEAKAALAASDAAAADVVFGGSREKNLIACITAADALAKAVTGAVVAADAADHAASAATAGWASLVAARVALLAEASDATGTPHKARFYQRTQEAIVNDFNILRALAVAENWTDATTVPQGDFGPLWPEGPPEGWPEEERTSENLGLVFKIKVPAGVSRDKVLELVAGLVERADAVHRAHGGHGLRIDEGNVEIDRTVEQPAPAGGRS